ncbi:hypothetical protein LTR96_005855 [Exophiala xenobiotica]|nr:hypothetical protein LTR40_009456 [Exophiala xenobiotica]KAK5269071.1 hypothetical protein LTR96_005855 [Exophiala xenobiotica]KAK5498161.1 hypothetical protein LTR26_001561 [Exophiala xenobiotica]KAK5503960.1 hypothetical protein LTR83_001885 [Exophiala xenobiotica]
MLCLSVYIFKLFFMVLLFRFHGCHAQLANESASPTITATWTGTYTDSVVCATAPADSLMDPPTAIRLGDLFCEALSKPENFPPQGGNLSQYHYPTELTEIPGSPNYTAMELSGLILDVFFYRNTPFVSNGTLELHGTDEQCARDNCTDIVAKDVDACQRNPYYYGGDNAWLTECGTYWVARVAPRHWHHSGRGTRSRCLLEVHESLSTFKYNDNFERDGDKRDDYTTATRVMIFEVRLDGAGMHIYITVRSVGTVAMKGELVES